MIRTRFKKAEGEGNKTLVGAISAIMIFIPLLFFFPTALHAFGIGVDGQICELTVQLHSKSFMGKSLVSIDCPRHAFKIEDEGIQIKNQENKKWETHIEVKTMSDEIFYELVANEMADCWRKMGEGEYNIFKESWVIGNKKPCIICSTISNKKDQFGTGKDLIEYMKGPHNYTKRDINENYFSYMDKEYFRFKHLTEEEQTKYSSIQIEEDLNIINNNDYVIFFTAIVPPKLTVFEPEYYIHFSENDKITDTCKMMIN